MLVDKQVLVSAIKSILCYPVILVNVTGIMYTDDVFVGYELSDYNTRFALGMKNY